jgi:hypothetical protein
MKTKLAAIILLSSGLSSTAVFAETAPEWNFVQGSVPIDRQCQWL